MLTLVLHDDMVALECTMSIAQVLQEEHHRIITNIGRRLQQMSVLLKMVVGDAVHHVHTPPPVVELHTITYRSVARRVWAFGVVVDAASIAEAVVAIELDCLVTECTVVDKRMWRELSTVPCETLIAARH
jgi:signal transduction histidine kinase